VRGEFRPGVGVVQQMSERSPGGGPVERLEVGETMGVVGEETAFVSTGGEMLDGEVAEEGGVLGEGELGGGGGGGGEGGDLGREQAGLEADESDEFRVVFLEGVGR
jgi:hypothetical protein